MDIESLRYFVAAAECGNITKTAQLLYTTQPNVTRHIKRVEREVGCPLFNKKGRGVELNENGKKVLSDSKIILRKFDKMKSDIAEKISSDNATLTIGYSGELKSRVLLELSKCFSEKYPNINITYTKQTVEPELLKELLNDEVDVIVASGTSGVHSENGLCSKILAKNNVVLALPKTHKYAQKELVNKEDLRGEKIIITPRELNPIFYDWAMSFALHSKQDVVFESDLETMMMKVVLENRIAVISKMYADQYNENISIVDFEYDDNEIDVNLLLSWKKDNKNIELKKLVSCLNNNL